ncbi:hypothetical protein HK097_002052 [Rhizophlyctis rosea]|uniref:CMP/dCMP-type deaminase domain-containing protein n=1 Tax=Rhizophlyctis rosea TaxID=64517 RepID=A0AAD5SFQ4_9FUNG|nr:hypothetical protein HK097_002052 [Rhizophlyctis rosea]
MRHEPFIRHVNTLAAKARSQGENPFAALVADAYGYIILETLDGAVGQEDPTAHAETLAVRELAKHHQDLLDSDADLTLYTSTEEPYSGPASNA